MRKMTYTIVYLAIERLFGLARCALLAMVFLSLVSWAGLLFFVGSGLGGCNLGSLAGLLDGSKDLRLREAYVARTNRVID